MNQIVNKITFPVGSQSTDNPQLSVIRSIASNIRRLLDLECFVIIRLVDDKGTIERIKCLNLKIQHFKLCFAIFVFAMV